MLISRRDFTKLSAAFLLGQKQLVRAQAEVQLQGDITHLPPGEEAAFPLSWTASTRPIGISHAARTILQLEARPDEMAYLLEFTVGGLDVPRDVQIQWELCEQERRCSTTPAHLAGTLEDGAFPKVFAWQDGDADPHRLLVKPVPVNHRATFRQIFLPEDYQAVLYPKCLGLVAYIEEGYKESVYVQATATGVNRLHGLKRADL